MDFQPKPQPTQAGDEQMKFTEAKLLGPGDSYSCEAVTVCLLPLPCPQCNLDRDADPPVQRSQLSDEGGAPPRAITLHRLPC